MMRKWAVLAVVGLVVASSPAWAAKGKGKGKGQGDVFARLDTNKDGKLSREEFAKLGQAAGKVGKGKGKGGKTGDALFSKLDTNGDGFIDKAEFAKLAETAKGKKAK